MIPPPPPASIAPLPRPAPVPHVGRTVAQAIAWRLERTEVAPLRVELSEAATVRPGGGR